MDWREQKRGGSKFVVTGRNEKRSEHKTFMLRDIDMKKIGNIRSLKQQILEQFGSEFVNQDLDFNVGYHKGTMRIGFVLRMI